MSVAWASGTTQLSEQVMNSVSGPCFAASPWKSGIRPGYSPSLNFLNSSISLCTLSISVVDEGSIDFSIITVQDG